MPDPPAGSFVEAVLAVVADIPPGRVLTYGDVAALLGTRAARAVGGVLARYGHAVPWWRVVRADGRPAAGHEEEALRYCLAEGAPVLPSNPARLDLAAARWRP